MVRAALVALLAALAGILAPATQAADRYPSKPVRVIVPFAAGSATDATARILAQELAKRLDQSVVVENRAGAFGQIAAQAVARSAPDGYTVFITSNTTHSANPHLYRTLPYDPIKDFEPVAKIGLLPFLLVVTPSLPVNSTAELIGYARAHPEALAYGTPNSASLVVTETIKHLAQVSIQRVQYKASPEAVLDLTAGRLQVMVADLTIAMPQVKAGKLRVLGVTTAKRTALLPSAAPIADAVPGVDLAGWFGVFVPAGTPKEIVARLSKELLDALSKADVRKRLADVGVEVDPLGPEAFGRFVREQIERWGRLIRAAGIQPE